VIEGISIIDLTPAGLLMVTVVLILTGRLVPRSMYNEKVKEADQWRAAYEAERTAHGLSDAQTRELLEVARTGGAVMSAVYENSERIKSGDS
jgi:hypothetical protein